MNPDSMERQLALKFQKLYLHRCLVLHVKSLKGFGGSDPFTKHNFLPFHIIQIYRKFPFGRVFGLLPCPRDRTSSFIIHLQS
jgi:hypothetical protein